MEFYKSKGGFAFDASVALDLGGDRNGCLIGVKYFGAINTLETSEVEQKSNMVGVFVKYTYRHRD